jgi:hypothetical protein
MFLRNVFAFWNKILYMSEICVFSMKVSSEGQVLLMSISLIKPAKKENESSVCIITYTRQQAA